jgi:patatin-like phospholipase/acyl hydrolase
MSEGKFKPLRENTAIAIDGGGIKGLIAAMALAEMEAQLGGTPLIENPKIKVLAGTSTGAILAGGIAVGLPMKDLVEMYAGLGETVFPRACWIPAGIRSVFDNLTKLFRPAQFDNHPLRKLLEERVGTLTLGELHEKMHRDLPATPENQRVLIFAVCDIADRRTRLLKSNNPKDAHIRVVDAILASAAAPTFLPVVKLTVTEDGKPKDILCADGGVGSFNNPAYLAAREITDWLDYAPPTVTVLSFGTGFLPSDLYLKEQGDPRGWRLIKWAANLPTIFISDAARTQSVDILDDYLMAALRSVKAGGNAQANISEATASSDVQCPTLNRLDPNKVLEFRRYQLRLPRSIELDDACPSTVNVLRVLGAKVATNLRENRFAPSSDPDIDPEGLCGALHRFDRSQRRQP